MKVRINTRRKLILNKRLLKEHFKELIRFYIIQPIIHKKKIERIATTQQTANDKVFRRINVVMRKNMIILNALKTNDDLVYNSKLEKRNR